MEPYSYPDSTFFEPAPLCSDDEACELLQNLLDEKGYDPVEEFLSISDRDYISELNEEISRLSKENARLKWWYESALKELENLKNTLNHKTIT